MTRYRHGVLAVVLTTGGLTTAAAQDTTASDRDFVLEGRIGGVKPLGGRTRSMIGPQMVGGVTLAFELSSRLWGWANIDYMPQNEYARYDDPRIGSPTFSLYALTGGLSRKFGLPFLPARLRPFELGIGAGATQTQLSSGFGMVPTSPPPGAEVEEGSFPIGYRRWRPAASVRFRAALPIGPLRLSGTAGVLVTYVGDVSLWNGGWEPAGDGVRYRPSRTVHPIGTLVAAPLSLGLGFRF